MPKVIGACHLCGQSGPLTFEHVPPRSAFNEVPTLLARGDQLFSGRGYDKLLYEKQRRGAGDYTLCEACNNNTGAWYGAAYVSWVKQASELLDRARGAPTLYYPFSIYPLRVLKQVVAMFFSVNTPQFRTVVPYLEGFVLSRERRHLPTDVRVYVAYALRGATRSSALSGLLAMNGNEHQAIALSEIVHFPFVFVMTFDSPSPDPRLTDISHFSRSNVDELRTLDLRLSVLPVNTPYPTDYRSDSAVKDALAAVANRNLGHR